mmetsp:Transcript_3301/g.5327  ORF Transcript_3301/g.5327 Transcript_3301/m.5327 type:complete len:238 (-) Transcript_3301:42-755(-)|eukprot:CAMPEP_0184327656 /NCGR_PEP_ID=MMETSP1049-20130417/143207_1 /TAXON_ID=77928 /ORGANISM="Proteomonas sulcata, Strain CCMP704" /LENGTH=237 /DNA_ID=CAMNT_0026649921 /DNA_START=1732 /DNA_END=2445 /DNA_ORIENTATION=-
MAVAYSVSKFKALAERKRREMREQDSNPEASPDPTPRRTLAVAYSVSKFKALADRKKRELRAQNAPEGDRQRPRDIGDTQTRLLGVTFAVSRVRALARNVRLRVSEAMKSEDQGRQEEKSTTFLPDIRKAGAMLQPNFIGRKPQQVATERMAKVREEGEASKASREVDGLALYKQKKSSFLVRKYKGITKPDDKEIQKAIQEVVHGRKSERNLLEAKGPASAGVKKQVSASALIKRF